MAVSFAPFDQYPVRQHTVEEAMLPPQPNNTPKSISQMRFLVSIPDTTVSGNYSVGQTDFCNLCEIVKSPLHFKMNTYDFLPQHNFL